MSSASMSGIKRALQDILAPEMEGLKSEIRRLDDKIDSFRNEMRAEIRRLDEKLGMAIDLRERTVAIETRLESIETK
ncbi:MAG: hypothetical protein FJ279_25220 [Planctomycetes bacterium]|nr:hypothetical protein [Planctomycetota bacterium]